MGADLSQLFVRTPDVDTVARALVDASGAVLPAGREWVAVLDPLDAVPVELVTAARDAVWFAVSPTRLTVRIRCAAGGKPLDAQDVPSDEGNGLMPWYVDAERQAWERMGEFGIPPALRLLRFHEIEHAPDAQGGMRLLAGGAPEPRRYRLRVVRERPPDGYALMNEASAADTYLVQGVMTPERVDHLLRTIDAIGRRKPRPPGMIYRPSIKLETDDRGAQEAAQHLLRERHAAIGPLDFAL